MTVVVIIVAPSYTSARLSSSYSLVTLPCGPVCGICYSSRSIADLVTAADAQGQDEDENVVGRRCCLREGVRAEEGQEGL